MQVRKQPRPHQLDAIEGLREGIRRGHTRLLLAMLMGAGKTVTALEMIRLAVEKGNRCLFLCDRRMLVDQGAREASAYGLYPGTLMAGRDYEPAAPVHFASKQTVEAWAKAGWTPETGYRLVVIDEAHRAMSRAWRQLLTRWPGAVVIGLTATPCHGNGAGLGDFYQWLVQPIKPSELLARGLIVPTRCYAPHDAPDLKGVGKGADGDWSAKQLERRLNKANLVGDVVGWWRKLGEDRTSVYFATGFGHALAVCNEFRRAGVTAEVIDQDTPDAEREAFKDRLKDRSLRVLVSVDVMTEGVDVPWLSLVGLVRPTKRKRRYLQMVGRGLRPCPEQGKENCVVIDHGGCVPYHGFPEADHEWALDYRINVDAPPPCQPGDPEPPRPATCPECKSLFRPIRLATGRVMCPFCRHVFTRRAEGVGAKAGTLVPVNGTPPSPDELARLQRQTWRIAINRAKKVGGKASMAAAIFKTRFGVPPWEAGVEPLPGAGEWQRPAAEVFK